MSTKDFSSVQEKKIADYLGWSTVSGSGSRPLLPGDVISEQWFGECKTHVERTANITFMRTSWQKLQEEASSRFKFPVLFSDDGSQDLSKTWCLLLFVPMADYIELEEPPCIRVNDSSIVFDEAAMSSYHKSKSRSQLDPIVYVSLFDGKVVYLVHFFDFAKLLGV